VAALRKGPSEKNPMIFRLHCGKVTVFLTTWLNEADIFRYVIRKKMLPKLLVQEICAVKENVNLSLATMTRPVKIL
jgi:hypothetical protein